MGAPRIKDEVVRYLSRHPGVTVWRKDIAADLNLNDQQVTSAIGSAFRASGDARNHIVVVEQGRAWRWTETPIMPAGITTGKRLFEELTTLPDGRILAKGDDGKVYWLSEV